MTLTKIREYRSNGVGNENASSVFMTRVVYIYIYEAIGYKSPCSEVKRTYVKFGVIHRKGAVDTMTLGERMGEGDPKRSPRFRD